MSRMPTHDELRQARVDRMIADCSDEDLADLKPMALARLPEPSRKLLADKRVRESRWLRVLVYEVLTEAISG